MIKDKIKRFFDTRLSRAILVLFGIGSIFLIWWVISIIIEKYILDDGVLNIFFPGPEVVIPVFFNMMGSKYTYINIAHTIWRLITSFLISFVIAMIFGTISGLFKPFERFFKPLVIVMRTIPPAVLILSLLMFMRYDYALLIIVMLVMFPLLYEAILSGYRNIDKNIINAMRLDTKPYTPQAFKVLIPSAAPYIVLGMIQTLGLGLKVCIMAEVLLSNASCKGIGVAFYAAKIDLAYDEMFAYSIYAIIIIAFLDWILSILKRRVKDSM